ncbi:MAG: hypothetical protein Q4F60_00240 [Candidatus Saccharibacteria bacterium]|nr:hypothetical protein [Candidatus Saccharibacteria bacterium]
MAIHAEITPSILVQSNDQLSAMLARYQGFAKRLHFDISDGQFSPTVTIPEASLRWPANIQCNIHMMVVNPSMHLQTLLQLKPALVIFHAEAGEDLIPIFDKLHEEGIKAGVAIMKQTYPEDIEKYILAADHVMLFTGNLGQMGGTADLLQLEKVNLIRKISPQVEIGWDGGANMTSVRAILHAGVTVINVGAALATASDPEQVYRDLVAESEKKGVLF